MKKRVFSLLALLLCAVFVLGSCSTGVKTPAFDDVYTGSNYQADTAWANKAQLSLPDGAIYQESIGDLVYFTSVDATALLTTHTIYNLATGATVLTVADTATVKNTVSLEDEYFAYGHIAFILLESTDTSVNNQVTTKLYDSLGTQVASAKGTKWLEYNLDLVIFDDVYYRVASTGTLTKVKEKAPLAKSLPMFYDWNDAYYYAEEEGAIEVYSAETLELLQTLVIPSRYDESDWHVLNNGNIFFQGGNRLPDDAEEFDWLQEEEKYAFDSFIFDVESGKTEEIKFDYYVEFTYATGGAWYDYAVEKGEIPALGEQVENIFEVYPFVDKYLEGNEYTAKLFLVSNEGKITGDLSGYLPQNSLDLPRPAPNGGFIASDVSDTRYLLGADGAIIGEVSGADDANSKYFVAGGKIMDFTLATVFDYEENGYKLASVLADSILLSKETKNAAGVTVTEYSLYKDGGLALLLGGEKNATISSSYSYSYSYNYNYIIFSYEEGGKSINAVYATNGTLLLTSDYAINQMAEIEGAALLSTIATQADGTFKTVYYRISK